jgi:hypothetical protein
VFADYNEVTGRLEFGVENEAAIPAVQRALTGLGLAKSTYHVLVTEPIVFAATLRDKWRPTLGGIQIHFGQYVCTMGFNAFDGEERSFITNSHCTNTQGGVEGTEYAQPTRTIDPTVIAVEVEDPTYFKGGVCPRGKKCRYSDASRAAYSSEDVKSDLGVIAKTSGFNNTSLEVTGTFTIADKGSAGLGAIVNKVGRTTGWTQGKVSRTCVNTSVQGSQVMQLCQTFVESTSQIVAGGDSGSQVFVEGSNGVTLVGLLWGGNSSGTQFVFSPLSQVEQELGTLKVN